MGTIDLAGMPPAGMSKPEWDYVNAVAARIFETDPCTQVLEGQYKPVFAQQAAETKAFWCVEARRAIMAVEHVQRTTWRSRLTEMIAPTVEAGL